MRLACKLRHHLAVSQNRLATIFGDLAKLMRVFLSCFHRNRQGSIEPVPDKWRQEGPSGATRR